MSKSFVEIGVKSILMILTIDLTNNSNTVINSVV